MIRFQTNNYDVRVKDGCITVCPSPATVPYLIESIQARIRLISHQDPTPERFEAMYRCVRIGHDLCTGQELELSREDANLLCSSPQLPLNSDALEVIRMVDAISHLAATDSGVPLKEMDRALKAIMVAHGS